MSQVDYAALMQAVADKLAAIAPTRVVTRTYLNFGHRAETDLTAGVFTVLAGGVRSYPWDRCDTTPGGDGPGASELPVFAFRVIGQGVLAESADGAAIEDAEFALIADIEALADALVDDDTLDEHQSLCRSVLKGVDQSGQLEHPYYWCAALFELGVT